MEVLLIGAVACITALILSAWLMLLRDGFQSRELMASFSLTIKP